MPEVIFAGPEGRLQGRYQPAGKPRPPIAIVLHPHPQSGGTMNNPITLALYQMFAKRGFATLWFNFRGVGRSEGTFDNGVGELSDAASALVEAFSEHLQGGLSMLAGQLNKMLNQTPH